MSIVLLTSVSFKVTGYSFKYDVWEISKGKLKVAGDN